MNFKNIKTDTMLQYYRHGSKAGFVKHMDVYLKSILPHAHCDRGYIDVKAKPTQVEKEVSPDNCILFTLSEDEALEMATQLIMTISQIKQEKEQT